MIEVEQVGLAGVDCVTCNSRGLRRHLLLDSTFPRRRVANGKVLWDLVRASVRGWVGNEAHWVYVRFYDGVLSGSVP